MVQYFLTGWSEFWKINLINGSKKLEKNIYRKQLLITLISNQKFNAENQVTRLCATVLVIFNTFPCSDMTGGVQLEGGTLFFNPSFIAALKEALRTVMVFIAAVGVAKTINFSYTITLSTCPIYVGFRPTVLASRTKNRGSEAHISWTCHMCVAEPTAM